MDMGSPQEDRLTYEQLVGPTRANNIARLRLIVRRLCEAERRCDGAGEHYRAIMNRFNAVHDMYWITPSFIRQENERALEVRARANP